MKRRKRDDARHQRQSEATLRIMEANRTLPGDRYVIDAFVGYYRDLKPRFTKKEGTPSDTTK